MDIWRPLGLYRKSPQSLIDEAIAAYRERYHEELTYEEAKEHVSYQQILDYMTAELNQKIRLYNVGDEKTPEALKKLLALSVEEVKELYDALPAEKKIAAAEVKFVEHSPIIPREDFEAAQKKINPNQTPSF